MTKSKENLLKKLIKEYKDEFNDDYGITYEKAQKFELEEMTPSQCYDLGYLDCLTSIMGNIK